MPASAPRFVSCLLFAMALSLGHGTTSLASDDKTAAMSAGALAELPVKEITVFKDGHAFVLHEGSLPIDDEGTAYLDQLPMPVLGTFWPYSADPSVELKAVVAGKQLVTGDRTALDIRDLLEANIGAKVLIKEGHHTYAATIVEIPRPGQADSETPSTETQPHVQQPPQVIVLKTAEGFKVVDIDVIRDVTFLEEPKTTLPREQYRNLLALKLAPANGNVPGSADVGMVYLQKGVRWIPNYRVSITGDGKAVVSLQATLLNELADLEGVTANLVIGVPSFYFQETADPIGLQQVAAQLSSYFQADAQTAYGLSNSIATQVSRMGEYRNIQLSPSASQPALPADLGPDVPSGGKHEDLFVFTVRDITLKKGERMVLPVVEFPVEYKDVYKLEIPFGPPPEVRRQFNTQQQAELAGLFHAPKARHNIRIANSSRYPLTTAPAMILREGRLLGQGLMTYTASGASVDLEITTAVDIAVAKNDVETSRTPNAALWSGDHYDRIDLKGAVTLTNYRSGRAELEITRSVLGNADKATTENGQVEKINFHEDWPTGRSSFHYPSWWSWYNWPFWWHHMNGISQIRWNVMLEPGETIDLEYQWHYFWRG